MHYSCKSRLQCSGFLVVRQRRRPDTFTFQKIFSLCPSACPGPSELRSALPITQPKFLRFSLTEALAGILAFRRNCSSKYILCSFTSLVFLKSKTLALSADPEERNCLVEEDIQLARKKMSGERKYRKSGCGSSWTFHEKTQRVSSFIFIA